jgi:hypothetical protein
MNPIRPASQSNICTVINQNFRPMGVSQPKNFPCQFSQSPRAEIPFTNLNQMYPAAL